MKDTNIKRNFFSAIVTLIFSVNAFSMGIGPQIDFTTGTDGNNTIFHAGISCSIKNDNFPLVISVTTDYNFSENSFNAFITGDYWIFNPMLGDYCSFFAGSGASVGGTFFDDKAFFCAAPRFVLGFSWIFYDGFFEYFVQAAFQPEWNIGGTTEFDFKIPCNTGIRLYF